jgi:hypothetical protein
MPCLVFDLERGRAAFRKRVQLDQTSPESNKIGLSVYRPHTALLRDYAEYGLKSGATKKSDNGAVGITFSSRLSTVGMIRLLSPEAGNPLPRSDPFDVETRNSAA